MATRRKRASAKRSSAKKRPARKAASKSRTRARTAKATSLKRKGLRAAKGGLKTVRQAGEKTWNVLRSTTAQVVEGVKDRLSDESDRNQTSR